jgi:micrococcal nuclease
MAEASPDKVAVQSAKIEVQEVTRQEVIPFTAQQQDNPSAQKGESRIIQAGVNGEKTLVYEVTYSDGVETKRALKNETVTKQPIPQIVTIGSRVAAPPEPAPTPAPQATNCVIKGNISSSGEKIYHMPGQRFYDETVITPGKGERYFCSATEAEAAGWRAAKV